MQPADGRIALWSTEYTEITGQTLVTRRVAERVLPALGSDRCYLFRPSGRPTAVLSWVGAAARLWRDAALGRVGTLYLVCSRSNAGFLRDVPALVLARFKIRVVVHAHGSDIGSLLTARPVSPLARWAYRGCELVLPSAHLAPALAELPLAALHVCENFAPATGASASPNPDPGPGFKLLWNSNVIASKGAFDVMAAVGGLLASGANMEFLVIGTVLGDPEVREPQAKKALEAYIRDGTARYLGRVPAAQSAALVAQADAVALPSHYPSELQPLAVIQAMCAGIAIVASDTPALRATLGDYPAELVPVRSVEAIAAALRRLIDEKAADPHAFLARRANHATRARMRFEPTRFDRTLAAILAGTRAMQNRPDME